MDGMELSLLESSDIVADTKAAVDERRLQAINISGIINFNCILRTLELEKIGKTDD